MPGRAGKIQHRRSLLIAPQRAIRGLPCPGFRQCVTDMLDRIPRRLKIVIRTLAAMVEKLDPGVTG